MATTTISRTNYNSLADDDGSGTTGTVWDKNQVKTVLLDQIDALFTANFELGAGFASNAVLSPAQITTTQNDYAPAGFSTTWAVRLGSDAARSITGLSARNSGTLVILSNSGGFTLTIAHESASSTAANRFACPNGANFDLKIGCSIMAFYDGASSRWRLVAFV